MSPWRAIPLALLLARRRARAVLDRGAPHAGRRRHRDRRPDGAAPGRGHDAVGTAVRLAARRLGGDAVRRGLGLHGRGAAPAVLPAVARPRPRSPTRSRASSIRRPGCPRPCSSPARRPTSCCCRRCRRPSTRRRCVLCGLVLLTAARAGRRLEHAEGSPPRGTLLLLGLVSGLALWTHLMSASVVAAAALWVLLRSRGRRRLLVWAVVPLVAASAPLWSRALQDERGDAHRPGRRPERDDAPAPGRDAAATARAARRRARHARAGRRRRRGLHAVPPRLGRGAHGPALRADAGPGRAGRHASQPGAAPVRGRGARARRVPVPGALGAAHDPLADAALSPGGRARGLGRLAARRVAARLGAGARPRLAPPRPGARGCWTPGGAPTGPMRRSRSWTCSRVRSLLDAHGVRHAYASYGPAFRLTWESGERIVASPPWNDRFRHWPLPLLDEVRFAKNVAWVLTPSVPSGLPTPDELEQSMRRLGGRWRRDAAGAAVVFHAFVPPFAPQAEPWPGAGRGGRRRPAQLRRACRRASRWSCASTAPRPLDAITLLAALDGPRLPRSADVQVSADGETFETVATRRRREERQDLRWVNGHPQAVIDHDVVAVPLDGRQVVALRVVALEPEPWRVGEVLIHTEAGRQPWDEWLPPGAAWDERRRALARRAPRSRTARTGTRAGCCAGSPFVRQPPVPPPAVRADGGDGRDRAPVRREDLRRFPVPAAAQPGELAARGVAGDAARGRDAARAARSSAPTWTPSWARRWPRRSRSRAPSASCTGTPRSPTRRHASATSRRGTRT